MLADYDGTLLLVSHDRDFLDRVVTSVIALDGDGAALEYPGGYSDYLRQRTEKQNERTARAPAPSPEGKSGRAKTQSKLSYKDARALDALQTRMPELEAEIADLEHMLADPGLYARDPELFHDTTRRHDALKADLAAAGERWLELEMKREALSGN